MPVGAVSDCVRYPHPPRDSDARLRPASIGCGALYFPAYSFQEVLSATIAGMLYGVNPGDSLISAGAAALLAAIALLAAFLPARRASRIDPMIALRYE
jgi:ABC-type antimicrobial peptide transport system permease subunit